MSIPAIDPLIQQFVRQLRRLVNESPQNLRPLVLSLVHDRATKQMMDKVPVQSRITTRPTLVDHSHNPEDASDDIVARAFFGKLDECDHEWTEDFLSRSPSLIEYVLAEVSGLNQQGVIKSLDGPMIVDAVKDASKASSVVLGAMTVAGFTKSGISRDSFAARMQGRIGNVQKGGLFSGIQSMGAKGTLTISCTVAVGVIYLLGRGIYEYATRGSPEAMLETQLSDPKWVEDFWQSKGL
ncbi:hypothetical protein FRB91_001945 [Serendipita sp. 411]|nr:hypothetical protein FRB91_001945 [Serendipita sp. 411]